MGQHHRQRAPETLEMFPELTPEAQIPLPPPGIKELNTVDERIWRYIKHVGLATADDVDYALELEGRSTASARVRMLVRAGHLEDSGERRVTRAGHSARLYRAVTPEEVVARPAPPP